MKYTTLPSLLLLLLPIATSQCIPNLIPLPNTITTPFAISVHNSSFPAIHQRTLNFWKAGGGDNHLFLSPAGDAVANHTLVAGVLTNSEWWEGKTVTIRAVINGEYTPSDNTTKIFMTQRGDPRAVFDLYEGCDQDTGATQLQLRLTTGKVCVRPASGERWEFRFSGWGNVLDQGCVHVNLVPEFQDDV